MIVFLQLTTAGVDSGPFDLYSNLNGYSEPFEENVSRALLIAGYSTDVPDYATVVRITSKENCISSVDITLRDVECDLAGYVELPCNVDIVSTVTTDPDNIPGDNGTATIVFEGGTAPFIYTLNSVEQGAAVSPLVINGLSASTSYTVEIIDSYLCNDSATFTLGESTFYFDADYIMLTYEFTDGLDLDTKTRMAIPDIGQDVPADYLGYLGSESGGTVYQWPPLPATPILTFGGDNLGTGFESVLIDIKQFKIDYPLETSFTIDARCLWFRPDDIGVNPVNVAATLWKGGIPVQDGCYEGQYYCWTNPTANNSSNIDSVGIVITSTNRICGQRAATLTYNLVTKIGVLNNNDTATPTVC